jgi:hypothetical protein
MKHGFSPLTVFMSTSTLARLLWETKDSGCEDSQKSNWRPDMKEIKGLLLNNI